MSIRLFGFGEAPRFSWPGGVGPTSKKVCQSTNRRGARLPPERSSDPPVVVRVYVEDVLQERLAIVPAEVGYVAGPYLAVPEPVRGHRELDRDKGAVRLQK